METKHKKFEPFDRIIVRDGNDIWQVDFYSHWNEEYKQHVTLAYGDGLTIEDNDILPYEGNEHLVGTTDEPEVPLSEKETQDTYWANCSEEEKKNLRKNYNTFTEDSKGRSILEKVCGKHNLQDEPEKEVKLEEGEWLMIGDGEGCFNNALQWHLSQFHRTLTINNEERFHVSVGLSTADCLYSVEFSNFNPNDMEETAKHILCVKDGKVVKYKG